MKVTCDRAALSDALSACTSIIASRTPKPILQCIRVTAAKDELILTAYDQELGLRYRVSEVDTTRPGETLVSGDRFFSIVRESTDESLALEVDNGTLHIRGRDSHFQIFGQDVRQFPPVSDLEGEPDLCLRADALRACIERTTFAAARESTRYAINGVLWEKRAKRLQLVATDGRRLARAGVSPEKSVGGDNDVIVPTKALTTLSRLHVEPDAVVDVQLQPNQIILRTPKATISSVLHDGHFPKYDDVIPKDCDKKLEIDAAEFLSAVKRAALLSTEETRGVRIAISSDGLIFSSRAPEQGEATIRQNARYSGPNVEIGFNPTFLVEALRVCSGNVSFEVKDGSKPGILRCGPDFLYVVMPVNLS